MNKFREIKFLSLKHHAWYLKIYKDLSEDDIAYCLAFINSNAEIDKQEFQMVVMRLMDESSFVNRKDFIIRELLLACS